MLPTESESCSVVSNSLWPHELQPIRLLCPWDSPGKNTRVGCHFLLQGIFQIQGSNPGLLHCRQILYHLSCLGSPIDSCSPWKLKSLIHVQLFATPWTIQSMAFYRPEHWSGYPFPSPGDLPNPGIKPRSPVLQAYSLPAEPQGKL